MTIGRLPSILKKSKYYDHSHSGAGTIEKKNHEQEELPSNNRSGRETLALGTGLIGGSTTITTFSTSTRSATNALLSQPLFLMNKEGTSDDEQELVFSSLGEASPFAEYIISMLKKRNLEARKMRKKMNDLLLQALLKNTMRRNNAMDTGIHHDYQHSTSSTSTPYSFGVSPSQSPLVLNQEHTHSQDQHFFSQRHLHFGGSKNHSLVMKIAINGLLQRQKMIDQQM